jgi:hypothetical protein
MAKWMYVGPRYASGMLMQDGSYVYPESQMDDAAIDSIIEKYPAIAPYWRLEGAALITEDNPVLLRLQESLGALEKKISDLKSTDTAVRHSQNEPSQTWEINHGLGKFPSVSIVDSGKSAVIGEVQYLDENRLIVSFSAAFSGEAFLN